MHLGVEAGVGAGVFAVVVLDVRSNDGIAKHRFVK